MSPPPASVELTAPAALAEPIGTPQPARLTFDRWIEGSTLRENLSH